MMRRALLVLALLAGLVGCKGKVAGGSTDGAEVFSAACAGCHGGSGQPDPGMVARYGVKDLTDPALQARLSDADIRKQILEGSKNRKMPAFRGGLSDAQLDALIEHVRSLKRSPTPRE